MNAAVERYREEVSLYDRDELLELLHKQGKLSDVDTVRQAVMAREFDDEIAGHLLWRAFATSTGRCASPEMAGSTFSFSRM